MRVILDIETTGINPFKDEIVAIGWSGLNKFDPRILVRFPDESEKDLIKRFTNLINSKNLILVGYNIIFDAEFLSYRLSDLNIETVDLLKLVEISFGRKYKLKDLAYYVLNIAADDVDGSEIPQLWKEKKLSQIYKHLYYDLKRTYELYKYFERRGLVASYDQE